MSRIEAAAGEGLDNLTAAIRCELHQPNTNRPLPSSPPDTSDRPPLKSQGQRDNLQLARLGLIAGMGPTFSVILPALNAERTVGSSIGPFSHRRERISNSSWWTMARRTTPSRRS